MIDKINNLSIGEKMFKWAVDLFPLNRSLTGQANRDTLKYLSKIIPGLKIKSFKSGQNVFDWTIPQEWEVIQAFIEDEYGNKIVDFSVNNLHLVGYSRSVDCWMELEELKNYLYSIPEYPEAIPYRTSYYNDSWGFCLSHDQLSKLENKKYHVLIDSSHKNGVMNYGELLIKGESQDEILLSTYICHPSMANNETSGIVVTTQLAEWIQSNLKRRFSYRILFIPETIGSIAYLSEHAREMKNHTIAGFVVTCVGDDNNYSFMPSRLGNTLSDKAAKYALDKYVESYVKYTFLERGSDERQYCSPLINLPIVSIMRSKYGEFKEYHTSEDNLDYISPNGLLGAFNIIATTIEIIEKNKVYIPVIPCEPQLGKRGLYNISSNENADSLINMLAYIDGNLDLMDIAKIINTDYFKCVELANLLLEHNLIKE